MNTTIGPSTIQGTVVITMSAADFFDWWRAKANDLFSRSQSLSAEQWQTGMNELNGLRAQAMASLKTDNQKQ